MDNTKVLDSIVTTMREAGCALTDDQLMILAGSLAVWNEQNTRFLLWPSLRQVCGDDGSDGLSFGYDKEETELFVGRLTAEIDRLRAELAKQQVPAVPDVQAMIDRFLSWKLPKDFCPDAGITFKPSIRQLSNGRNWAEWPSGTNLLNAEQAREMIVHLLAAAPEQPNPYAGTHKHEGLSFVKAERPDATTTIIKDTGIS